MTRYGSIAYYLASWVCGSCFAGIFFWLVTSLRSPLDASVFFAVIFFSLMYGAATSLLFGFLLRWLASLVRWSRDWHWVVGGAILAPALVGLLKLIVSHASYRGGWLVWLYFPLYGAELLAAGNYLGLSRAIVPGAATAWVLFRIHRAFAAETEYPPT